MYLRAGHATSVFLTNMIILRDMIVSVIPQNQYCKCVSPPEMMITTHRPLHTIPEPPGLNLRRLVSAGH
jgi:hypothetical protein